MSGKGKYKDLTGEIFDYLKVIKKSEVITNDKYRAYWLCECNCGNSTVVSTTQLRLKRVRSCGCIKSESYVKGIEVINESSVDGVLTTNLIRKRNSNNSSGYKGVTKCKNKKGETIYRAVIAVNGKKTYLGDRATAEEAYKLRLAAEEKLFTPYLDKLKNN